MVESYNAWYDYAKQVWVDTGDLEKDADGNPIWAGYRTDLRQVSGGKKPKYELHPSTGGLALGSKPDNKGHWQQVKGGSIDPAVLFIDRCLQLLKPGGRLLIVLPDGVLCNSGDRYVREYIMGKKDERQRRVRRRQGHSPGRHLPAGGHLQALRHRGQDLDPVSSEAPRRQGRPQPLPA